MWWSRDGGTRGCILTWKYLSLVICLPSTHPQNEIAQVNQKCSRYAKQLSSGRCLLTLAVPSCRRPLPPSPAPRTQRCADISGTGRDSCSAAHLRRCLCAHITGSILVCPYCAQDLHQRVLLHWRPVCRLWRRGAGGEPIPPHARQSAILQRDWR